MSARDYLAEAESCSEYMDDTQRVLLGIGQQLRRIADQMEPQAKEPFVVNMNKPATPVVIRRINRDRGGF